MAWRPASETFWWPRRTAADAGARDVYLLTTTAEDYFPRFGFALTSRESVPPALKRSAEFTGACPDSAAVMLLSLTSDVDPGRIDPMNGQKDLTAS